MVNSSVPLLLTVAVVLVALSCTGASVGIKTDGAPLSDSTCYEVFGMD